MSIFDSEAAIQWTGYSIWSAVLSNLERQLACRHVARALIDQLDQMFSLTVGQLIYFVGRAQTSNRLTLKNHSWLPGTLQNEFFAFWLKSRIRRVSVTAYVAILTWLFVKRAIMGPASLFSAGSAQVKVEQPGTVPQGDLQYALALPGSDLQSDSVCTQSIPTAAWQWQDVFSRLSVNERRRRLWHMLPGLVPLTWILLPHEVPISTVWQCCFLGLATVFGILACYHESAFARDGETNCLCSPISYAVVGVVPVLLFPAHPEISATALAVLALGDGSAALGGMLLRGPTLPWNRDKTWSGFLCFLGVSIPVATFYFWSEAEPQVSLPIALFATSCAAIASVIAESIPSKINDNIRVGVVAITTVLLVEWLVFGWH
jgi:dolichol kinase